MVRIFINEKIIQLSVKAIEFKISGKPKKLVSLQNIKSELDEKEVDSWQKLISILRHEIMNSTVPITATIKIIADFFKKKGTDLPRPVKEIDEEVIRHTIRGLGIIEERSEGLVEFVEKYRS